MKKAFNDVTEWVFDLDNTLYPRHCDLFAQIDWKMTDYIADRFSLPQDEARLLQKQLYRSHGTTLRGLMALYHIDPHDFLANVHDIDYTPIAANPALDKTLALLPGRKHIFTNGDVPHAERTLERLGIGHHFSAIFDILAADFIPKPAHGPYQEFLNNHGVNPQKAAMFEDMPRNLYVPKEMGMRTILILPQKESHKNAEAWEHAIDDPEKIDFSTDDLADFLNQIINTL